jgi:hypothetical protein
MIPNRGNNAGHLVFIAQVKPLFIESVPKQFSILTQLSYLGSGRPEALLERGTNAHLDCDYR